MPQVGITHFDEDANLHTTMVEVTKEALGYSCWLPARFLGGVCDRYYICKYAVKANCKAGPSKLAREKVEHLRDEAGLLDEVEIDGEQIRQDLICRCCGEIIEVEPGEFPYFGDEGTKYAGEFVCNGCYEEDFCSGPIATVYYGRDDDEPRCIGAVRNETEGNFTAHWHSTDAWRGYIELGSDHYVQIFTDAILSGHESEEMLKRLYDLVMERFEEEGVEFVRAFCGSSNLFCTYLDLWVAKDLEQLMKAHIILAEVKAQVDFDNPLYKTGILFPRENLERFKQLLGQRYEVKTDGELADLVARKGDALLTEILAAQKGETRND